MNQYMTAKALNQIIADLKELEVLFYLDGGWGVDALLGEETRPHKDADLIIFKRDLQKVKEYFLSQGYIDKTEGNVWWHFFMEKPDTAVDFLVIESDNKGGAFLGPQENDMYFPPEAFDGIGYINDQKVNCLDAAYRVKALTREFGVVVKNRYQITEKDCRDLILLCKKFDLPVPADYTDHMNSKA